MDPENRCGIKAGEDFLQKTLLQARLNRMRHGDDRRDDSRPAGEWAMIAGEQIFYRFRWLTFR